MSDFSVHNFYCINCGEKGITVPRRSSFNYQKHHRKKMWCPWCKMEINHIECRSDEDVIEFKNNFQAGLYKEEAKNSISYIQKERSL